MSTEPSRPVGVDSFWEQADHDCSGQHPLERELCHHLDVLVRYRRQLDEALADGRDGAINLLFRHYRRAEDEVARLREQLNRLHSGT